MRSVERLRRYKRRNFKACMTFRCAIGGVASCNSSEQLGTLSLATSFKVESLSSLKPRSQQSIGMHMRAFTRHSKGCRACPQEDLVLRCIAYCHIEISARNQSDSDTTSFLMKPSRFPHDATSTVLCISVSRMLQKLFRTYRDGVEPS